MTKKMTLMIIGLVVFFGAIFGWWGIRKVVDNYVRANYVPPPVAVSASKAIAKTWHPFIPATGSIIAINGVEITSEVSGTVTKITFDSGQVVQKGALLVHLDTSVLEAELNNGLANLKLAEINNTRNQILAQRNAVSKSAADVTAAKLQEAQANVQKVQAQLAQKNITAPFTGKLGIRLINLGSYMSPGDPIVSLQALNPLYVNFSLPEQEFKNLSVKQEVDVMVDTYPGMIFKGKINAINSKVTQQTRSINVQATIPNDKLLLLPGMFADVHVIRPQLDNVITVPQTAVDYSLYGDSIYVIKPYSSKHPEKTADKEAGFFSRLFAKITASISKKLSASPLPSHKDYYVVRQFVTVSERRGTVAAIAKGIKAGDLVVTSGQLKLKNNTRVVINNTVEM